MARREPDVDRWMKGKPAEPVLRRVRDIILWADDRMTEYLKSGTVQSACKGDFANFVHHNEKTVTLIFNRGAKLQGNFPSLKEADLRPATCVSPISRTWTPRPRS